MRPNPAPYSPERVQIGDDLANQLLDAVQGLVPGRCQPRKRRELGTKPDVLVVFVRPSYPVRVLVRSAAHLLLHLRPCWSVTDVSSSSFSSQRPSHGPSPSPPVVPPRLSVGSSVSLPPRATDGPDRLSLFLCRPACSRADCRATASSKRGGWKRSASARQRNCRRPCRRRRTVRLRGSPSFRQGVRRCLRPQFMVSLLAPLGKPSSSALRYFSALFRPGHDAADPSKNARKFGLMRGGIVGLAPAGSPVLVVSRPPRVITRRDCTDELGKLRSPRRPRVVPDYLDRRIPA